MLDFDSIQLISQGQGYQLGRIGRRFANPSASLISRKQDIKGRIFLSGQSAACPHRFYHLHTQRI